MELAKIVHPTKDMQWVCGQVCLILSDATAITWAQTKQALGKGDMLTNLKKLHPSSVLE